MLKQLVTCCLLLALNGYAEIRSIDSLTPVHQELAACNEKTLILLDIGGTLLAYNDPVFHKSHEPWKREWFQTHLSEMCREEKISLFYIVAGDSANWHLIDSSWPEFIAKAQGQHSKVVAFSKVLIDPCLRDMCLNHLHTFGLPIQNDLPELVAGTSYEYSKGIIATEADLKGPILLEVLSKLSFRPEKIVFVDDREDQVQSVDNACQQTGIPCVVFHYIAFQTPPPLDEKVADLQLRTLVKERRWLSESEARCILLEQKA